MNRFRKNWKDFVLYAYRRVVAFRWRFLTRNSLRNIYICSVQKSGSQWIKNVMADPVIVRKTGMTTYPQHDYEYGEFVRKFPRKTVVTGLYISYMAFEFFIRKPDRSKVLYMVRDPRSLIVSWYYSMLNSHTPRKGVNEVRVKLQGLSKSAGVDYAISLFSEKLGFQSNWVECAEIDTQVKIVRFEDIVGDIDSFREVFTYFEIPLSDLECETIFSKYSKTNMQLRDSKRIAKTGHSHYRPGGGTWGDDLSVSQEQRIRALSGRVIEKFYSSEV